MFNIRIQIWYNFERLIVIGTALERFLAYLKKKRGKPTLSECFFRGRKTESNSTFESDKQVHFFNNL